MDAALIEEGRHIASGAIRAWSESLFSDTNFALHPTYATLQDYWGKVAIAEWAARDIIGVRLTMYVVNVLEHYEHVVVTAHIDGDYDKRGLPDPLALTFHFSPRGDEIVQLIILRNHAGI